MSVRLQVEEVSVRRGATQVVTDVSLTVEGGTVTALLGRNGAGKSSLMLAMAGLVPLERGTVALNGVNTATMPRQALARRIASMGQDERPDDELLALEVVLLGRAPHLGAWGLPGPSDEELARNALAATEALPFALRSMRTLSGGENQRVLLARVLCQGGEVLLLDEPTHALDPGHALRVMKLLRELAAKGAAVVVVLHDLSLAARCADVVVVMDEGRVISRGAPRQALSKDILARAFRAELSLVDVHGHPVVVAD
mgnify:CR=1 FL=1